MYFSGRSESDPTAAADVKGNAVGWVNLFGSYLAKMPNHVRGLINELDGMFTETGSTLELDSYRCAPPVASGNPFGPSAAAENPLAAGAPGSLVQVHGSSIGSSGTWGSRHTPGGTFDSMMRGLQAGTFQTNCRRGNRSALKFQLRKVLNLIKIH